MASPHVPLPIALRVPQTFAPVHGYLALHDPDLRIRRSIDRPRYFVLERRCRRRPAVHTGRRDNSDIHVQARDGYIHVATVHPSYLARPWNIVRALQEEGVDLFTRTAAKIADELDYEQTWAEETARRRRKDEFRAAAREMFDLLDRHGNADGTERTRLSNPGLPPSTSRRGRAKAKREARRRLKTH